MIYKYRKLILCLFLVLITQSWAIDENSMLPPIDAKFRPRVDFWKKVYTEINSDQGFIHDKERPEVIYRKVDFKTKHYQKKARASRAEINKVKNVLRSIMQKNFKDLNQTEKEFMKISGADTKTKIHQAIRNLRTQYGLKDNYYIGLKRSHRYLDYIKKVFDEYGLPKELIYLPHVESSFNYRAYSKVGAAGIWQFMRSTARLYGMKISYVIDERRDPFIATIAAAKLLRFNYSKIESWPLAITAYNHGLRSMERAVMRVGSKKISDIIEKYDGRRFGFASKNFYATFIATVEISQNPQKYFPSFIKPPKFLYSQIKLPNSLTVKQILKALDITENELQFYNPSIRSIAYRSSLQLPKGFNLQLPPLSDEKKQNYLAQLEQVKPITADMRVATVHKIKRGDSLYTLSKIYNVSIHNLIVFNQISNPSRIFPGMEVKIPGGSEITKLNAKKVDVAQTSLTATDKKEVASKPIEVAQVESNISEQKIDSKVAQIAETQEQEPPKKSWYDRLLDWYNSKDEDPAAIKEDIKEDMAEVKKSEVASTLVNLDNYDLNIKNLSNDLYEITIETDETLGHYSDWSLTKMAEIKHYNRMNRNSTVRIGQKLKLKLTAENLKRFISNRAEYHLSIQEDFFQNYSIAGTEAYTVQPGDSLSQILIKNEVPLWLFRKYQEKGFNHLQALRPGQIMLIPQIEQR